MFDKAIINIFQKSKKVGLVLTISMLLAIGFFVLFAYISTKFKAKINTPNDTQFCTDTCHFSYEKYEKIKNNISYCLYLTGGIIFILCVIIIMYNHYRKLISGDISRPSFTPYTPSRPLTPYTPSRPLTSYTPPRPLTSSTPPTPPTPFFISPKQSSTPPTPPIRPYFISPKQSSIQSKPSTQSKPSIQSPRPSFTPFYSTQQHDNNSQTSQVSDLSDLSQPQYQPLPKTLQSNNQLQYNTNNSYLNEFGFKKLNNKTQLLIPSTKNASTMAKQTQNNEQIQHNTNNSYLDNKRKYNQNSYLTGLITNYPNNSYFNKQTEQEFKKGININYQSIPSTNTDYQSIPSTNTNYQSINTNSQLSPQDQYQLLQLQAQLQQQPTTETFKSLFKK